MDQLLSSEDEDLSVFNISLYPAGDSSSFHTRNDPDAPFQRDNIIERKGKVDVRCEHKDIVHGYYSGSGDPCTLLVFEFQFSPSGIARRIKQANIVIQFSAMERGGRDPLVEAMYPKGTFRVHPTTQHETLARGGRIKMGGGFAGIHISGELRAEKAIDRDTMDATMVRGSVDLRGRTWGHKNSVSWTLWENASAKTGVVTTMQAAVRLKRRDMKHFKAKITIKVEADLKTTMGSILKTNPRDDDVWYNPDSKPQSTDRLYKYDVDNLDLISLESLSHVTYMTVLEAKEE